MKKEKVLIQNLGTYIRVIQMDYNPKNNEELAELISQEFNVVCTEEDIEHYEELCEEHEFLMQSYDLEEY